MRPLLLLRICVYMYVQYTRMYVCVTRTDIPALLSLPGQAACVPFTFAINLSYSPI